MSHMEAGRELDAFIAERVMGWTKTGVAAGGGIAIGLRPGGEPGNINHYCNIPAYSTDIAAAWAVVEKMRELGFGVSVGADPGGTCHCEMAKLEWRGSEYEEAITAPLAICLAALAALAAANDQRET